MLGNPLEELRQICFLTFFCFYFSLEFLFIGSYSLIKIQKLFILWSNLRQTIKILKNPILYQYLFLHYRFFMSSSNLFFILLKVVISFTTILKLLFFFFFRKISISFISMLVPFVFFFFWKPSFFFDNILLTFFIYRKENIKKYFVSLFICFEN